MTRLLAIVGILVVLVATFIVVESTACGPFEECKYAELRLRRPVDELPLLESHLYSIWASNDGEHIVAGGNQRSIFESTNGGKTWTQKTLPIASSESDQFPNQDDVIGVAFSDKRSIALLRSGRELENDATSWRELTDQTKAIAVLAPLQSAQLDDSGIRSVVTSKGEVFETINGDTRRLAAPASNAYGDWMYGPERARVSLSNGWIHIEGKNSERLAGARAVAATPPDIVVVGAAGVSASSMDGGRSWSKRFLPGREDFNAVWLNARGLLALAAGDYGVILRSSDGGQTWLHVTFDRNAAGGSTGVARPPPWALAVNVIALLVAMPFVWNRPISTRLKPAERLKERLSSDRPLESDRGDVLEFRPVAEALAKLLRSADTSLPIVIAINGAFGTGKSSIARMVGERLRRAAMKVVYFDAWHHESESDLLASLFESVRQSIGLDLHFRFNLVRIRTGGKVALTAMAALVLGSLDSLPGLSESVTRGVALLAATYATIQAASSAVVLGIIRTIASMFLSPTLDAPLGLRQRFIEALSEITRAFGKRRIVIIVDDLDRCDEAKRPTVLNAINFITAAADCAFIITMDRAATGQETLLKKIVDLDTGVPVMLSGQTKRLLSDDGAAAPVIDWTTIGQHVRHVTVAVVLALMLWMVAAATIGTAGLEVLEPGTMKRDVASTVNSVTSLTAVPASRVNADVMAPSSRIHTSLSRLWRRWRIAVISVGVELLLIVILIVSRPGTPPIHDSAGFTAALDIWSDIIYAAHRTPRDVKRFANRARFLALYQSAMSAPVVVAALARDELKAGDCTDEEISQAREKHDSRFVGHLDLDSAVKELRQQPVYWRGDHHEWSGSQDRSWYF